MRALLLVVTLAGCPAKRPAVENIATPSEGTAIAVYLGRDLGSAIALIDDRQRIAVANNTFLLDRVEPGSQPLLIEPLDPRQPFRVGACTRERVAGSSLDLLGTPRVSAKAGQPRQPLPVPPPGVITPQLRCAVTAAPGTHLVRVLHHTPLPGFQAFHEAHYDGGARAKLTTRFVIKSLSWGTQRAALTVFEGLPGDRSPAPIARGEVVLDGSTTVLANPPIEAPARLRVIYDGGLTAGTASPKDPAWRRESKTIVATVLELDGVELAAGQVDVHFSGIQLRDVTVAQRDRERIGDTLRLQLDAVTHLRGERRNTAEVSTGKTGKLITNKIAITVTNASDEPKPVSIEEQLRPGVKRVTTQLPPTAKLVGDVVRADVVVPPHGNQRLEIKVTYAVGL